jgi:arylsulfatase A-like enzyme
VRFADATVQWPKTWPSLASILTGTYPASTGVHVRYRPLAPENLTLAEILGQHGFRTGAVIANPNVGRDFGYDQGFGAFIESWAENLRQRGGSIRVSGRVKQYTDAALVTEQARAWLADVPEGAPFFLWVHYMDPHGPYDPPPGLADRFVAAYDPRPVPTSEIPSYQWVFLPKGGIENDLARYEARYDGEIFRFDEQLAGLLEALDERGLRARTVVALTADHGESLSEHGYYLEHGMVPFQQTAHVPLVLSQPGSLPEGLVVGQSVALVDLVPTLLDLLHVPAPPTLQGRSLLPLVSGQETAPRTAFMESGYGAEPQLVARRGRWKLVHTRSAEDRQASKLGEWALFDLEADPEELHDVASAHPEEVRELREALDAWWRDTPRRATPASEEAMEPTTREMLEELGYVEPEKSAESSDAARRPERAAPSRVGSESQSPAK